MLDTTAQTHRVTLTFVCCCLRQKPQQSSAPRAEEDTAAVVVGARASNAHGDAGDSPGATNVARGMSESGDFMFAVCASWRLDGSTMIGMYVECAERLGVTSQVGWRQWRTLARRCKKRRVSM